MTLSVASIALTADLPHPDPPIPESDFGGSAANGSDFRRRAISEQFGGRAAGRPGCRAAKAVGRVALDGGGQATGAVPARGGRPARDGEPAVGRRRAGEGRRIG